MNECILVVDDDAEIAEIHDQAETTFENYAQAESWLDSMLA